MALKLQYYSGYENTELTLLRQIRTPNYIIKIQRAYDMALWAYAPREDHLLPEHIFNSALGIRLHNLFIFWVIVKSNNIETIFLIFQEMAGRLQN